MTKKERWELFTRLVNEEINNTLEMWSNDPRGHEYLWGWRYADETEGSLGSNHGNAFFYEELVINLANALQINHFLEVRNNEDGQPTPCVRVWCNR